MKSIYLTIVLLPLLGALIAGLTCRVIPRALAHWITISSVALSCGLSLYVGKLFLLDHQEVFNQTIYTWMVVDGLHLQVGFLVDTLTAVMISVVTFVSLMVHIYTIGYMSHDEGYQRFFSYIALFTFAMLMLVMSNNFLQLFFGWEAVGLVSYLLIGFYVKRESAIFANMKAFIVNRVGDFGFILGIAAVAMYFGSLDYVEVFNKAPQLSDTSLSIMGDGSWSVLTVICILLFVGAMGKSAQVPLHVWLPDSMEGPTPISALIHAATMVTAGIFMVARMSPLYELSPTALSFVLIIGATTAFFMGLIGIVQNDIKRVIAYSTLSQLGYMVVALGVSAYAAGIFHLMTHAFFKALLFLAAGSVIIGMHHDQDIRNMGNIRKYMPITYVTFLIGTLALIGFPGFAGFFSKDAIISAVHASSLAGSGYAYWMVLAGVFVTALYSFRLFFIVFHGKERMDDHTREHLKESPWVVTLPLILLAIPSIFIGALAIEPLLFGPLFEGVIKVLPQHDVLETLREEFHGIGAFVLHGMMEPPFWLAMGGLFTAWFVYMKKPQMSEDIKQRLLPLYNILDNKYGFDDFNQKLFAGGSRALGSLLWKGGDVVLIDGLAVNGSAKSIGWFSSILRHIQTGYLYHYAMVMIVALLALLFWFV
ncbi:MAG: NADH-quinone oxidoreductase subunit L [gamma proteobacterium symbiont of Bathyaustriella thionipta]|nr:NADH-quinone oxidoreductase subunit L [gamma proteobacterium symbiont of Bathyaustriella thionipta]